MTANLLRVAVMLGLFVALLAGLRAYARRRSPHPEVLRKLLHVASGLLTLSFPWVFDRSWPVLVLTGASIALLLAVKRLRPLKAELGPVVSGIGRHSLGEIYFPLAVGTLFLLSEGNRVLFVIPILMLTVADAGSALVGIRFGRHRYEAAGGRKSVEGSLAFVVLAFAAAFIPLLLMTDRQPVEAGLLAVTLALLVTLLEAGAWHGLDNLFIPLGGFLLLRAFLGMPGDALRIRLGVVLVLLTFVLGWRERTTLEGSGLVAGAFIGYLMWALGGWRWLVPPMVVFIGYTLLSPRTAQNSRRIHDVQAVLSVTSGGLVWLVLAARLENPSLFFFAYALAFAAHLAIIGIARLKCDFPAMPDVLLLGVCVLRGWFCVFLPFVVVERFSAEAAVLAVVAFAGTALGAIGFYLTQPGLDDCPTDRPRWVRQALCAWAASAVSLIPLQWR